MLEILTTKTFKKDLKKFKHQKDLLLDLQNIIESLVRGAPLPKKNRDHNLSGNWKDFRECHVRSDCLLIFKVDTGKLFLVRFGSHSELFD